VASPPEGGSSVASMRRVVVFPAPLGPRKPKISPAAIRRSTPATASTSPLRVLKTRRRPRVSIMGSVGIVFVSASFNRCLLLFEEEALDLVVPGQLRGEVQLTASIHGHRDGRNAPGYQ